MARIKSAPKYHVTQKKLLATTASRKAIPGTGGLRDPAKIQPGAPAPRKSPQEMMPTEKGSPKAAFERIVREELATYGPNPGYRIQKAALLALQDATEDYLVDFFGKAWLAAGHANRKTLFVKDINLVKKITSRR